MEPAAEDVCRLAHYSRVGWLFADCADEEAGDTDDVGCVWRFTVRGVMKDGCANSEGYVVVAVVPTTTLTLASKAERLGADLEGYMRCSTSSAVRGVLGLHNSAELSKHFFVRNN
ncbi:hypothetical protein Pelo_11836 [Pelomyxa schiedti]|nr:hypothetical protein Pelo_11836 [Pelomyxa schiedti]